MCMMNKETIFDFLQIAISTAFTIALIIFISGVCTLFLNLVRKALKNKKMECLR